MTVIDLGKIRARRLLVMTEYNPNHKDKWTAWPENQPNDFIGFGATEAEAVQHLYECIADYEEGGERATPLG